MMEFKNKNVLITGATGLVGSNLVHRFMQEEGVNVIALARSINKIRACFDNYLNDERFSYIVQDVTEPIKCNKRVDYIFHTAGPMDGNTINNCPVDVIKPNIYGLENCLGLLRNQKEYMGANGRLIVFSSITVYGKREENQTHVVEENTDIAESLDVKSASYSEAKRMAEVFSRAYAMQYDVDVVIARLSSVYGYTKLMPNTAFYEFINKAIRGETIEIKNTNIKIRDNIYIDDAINGLLYIAVKGECCEAYNISSNGEGGNYASIDRMASLMIDLVKCKYHLDSKLILPPKVSYYSGISMNNDKLKALGWRLSTELKDGIDATIEAMNYKPR